VFTNHSAPERDGERERDMLKVTKLLTRLSPIIRYLSIPVVYLALLMCNCRYQGSQEQDNTRKMKLKLEREILPAVYQVILSLTKYYQSMLKMFTQLGTSTKVGAQTYTQN